MFFVASWYKHWYADIDEMTGRIENGSVGLRRFPAVFKNLNRQVFPFRVPH